MKKRIDVVAIILFITLALIFSAQTAVAQDPVKVDSKHYKVEAENAWVRVLRIDYGPKEKSVMHKHPAGVVVYLADSKVKFGLPGGKSQEQSGKAGEAGWIPAGTHLPENLGDKPIEAILVELKAKPAGAKSAAAEDPLKTDPQIYKAEVENDRVRVLRVQVGPHAKTAMHSHPANVVIFLTDGRIKFSFPDGKTQEAQVKAGQVLLDNPVKHAGENLSDKPAEVMVVELKGGGTAAKPAAKKPGA
ncbi:MAG: cupin domain-containing protein [Acidobacteria bacterium]|nr:cupin domain-containing protein [Acidobacteriota bacterium]